MLKIGRQYVFCLGITKQFYNNPSHFHSYTMDFVADLLMSNDHSAIFIIANKLTKLNRSILYNIGEGKLSLTEISNLFISYIYLVYYRLFHTIEMHVLYPTSGVNFTNFMEYVGQYLLHTVLRNMV